MKLYDNVIDAFLSLIRLQNRLFIQIDITNACNLSCKHCYHSHHNNNGAIGYSNWIAIIDQYGALLKKLRLGAEVHFCGGEPTLSPHLDKIFEHLNLRFPKVPIKILSNGTLLKSSRIKKYKDYDVEFQISIDGPDETSHDKVRGSGSFNKAINGIRLLVESEITTTISAVLSKRNAASIPDFFSLAQQLQVDSMNFTRLIPEGAGKELVVSGDDEELLGLELKEAMENIVKYSKSSGVSTNTNKPLFHLLDEKLGQNSHFGWQGIIVDYMGNMKVSSRSNYILGNVMEDGMEDLFLNSKLMKDLRDGKIEGCGTCPHYVRCGGDRNVSYAHYGSFLNADPGCWINI